MTAVIARPDLTARPLGFTVEREMTAATNGAETVVIVEFAAHQGGTNWG